MAPVLFRQAARADFDAIVEFIASDNPDRAFTFVDELEEACLRFGEFPDKAPLVPSLGLDIRRLIHGTYNIYYRHESGRVIILRVLHAAKLVDRNDVT